MGYDVTTDGLIDPDLAAAAIADVGWAVATGTANAIVTAYSPANAALIDGLAVGFRALLSNTSATPTFAPDGLAPYPITKRGGLPLVPGDILGPYGEYIVRFCLIGLRWELLNPAVSGGPWVVAGGTADVLTATYSPAIPALTDGLTLNFRASLTNLTTTPTFSPNGLTARTFTKLGGAALLAGDIALNGEYTARYNLANTRWELVNFVDGPGITAAIAVAAAAIDLHKVLTSDDTGGTNVNTAQPWFPTAGSVVVAAGATYLIDGFLWLSRAAGSTSHTTANLFGGTATITLLNYTVEALTGDANALAATNMIVGVDATATVVKAASTSTTEQEFIRVRGVLKVNAGGTLIPQFKYSAAPGGAPTVKAGTYFHLRVIGTNPQGTWA